jgi:tight adherence protein C
MDFSAMAIPVAIFIVALLCVWALLSVISSRNSRTQERLERFSRPASLAEIEVPGAKQSKEAKLAGVKKAMEDLGALMKPKSELEESTIRLRLANAGFRSESAAAMFQGLRFASLCIFGGFGILWFGFLQFRWPFFPDVPGLPASFPRISTWIIIFIAMGMYIPNIVLWYLKSQRQQAIFLSLPDALDLLVVCVESGLGLDAALRRVTEEMKDHAKVLCEEFTLANFQLQMGRPRREVLHDLGVRTGVDDVRSLAAILIQADRFGSSIAQALRVQSDSMRVRRRQIAEEKAAKTAVQLIFPLVLFIFPGIFVVLVGPAAIQISEGFINPKQ